MKDFVRLLSRAAHASTLAAQFLLDVIFPPGDDRMTVRTISHAGLIPFMRPGIVNAEEIDLYKERHTKLEDTSTAESRWQHFPPRIIALLPYPRRAVKACVRQTKFHDNPRAAQLLGNVLARFLHERIDIPHARVVLIPIALSQKRKAERGYNQAERIIRAALETPTLASAGLVRLDTKLLKRLRNTAAQTTLLNEERLANMRQAFVCRGAVNPEHAYILIDDVTTTGATFYAASAALYKAGAQRVLCVALAH